MSLMMPESLGVDTSLGSGVDENPILAAGNTAVPAIPTIEVPKIPGTADAPGSTNVPSTTATGTRGEVVNYAKRFLGDPYVWGGTKPGGFDCSGLMQYVLSKAGGINLPRISAQQARYGTKVGYDGLKAGDLVAWDNSSRNNGADHIALYIGNGYIIEAPRAGVNVRIRYIGKDLDGGWGVHLTYSGEGGSSRFVQAV